MVSAGEIPDVMEMPDTWLSLYANNGLLESLEPYLAKWEHTAGLTDRALELGRDVKNTAYMLPYGFYLRAMFYNKKLFQEAGVAEPPKTMDEFVDGIGEGRQAARQIRLLPARRTGRPQRLGDVRRQHGRLQHILQRGRHLDHEQRRLGQGPDLGRRSLQEGLAPKDSVNWGFNEIVAGFYTGTCAMLDQDPDALIAIAERMKPEDYGIMTMPKGPDGKTFPTIGYAGWSMMAASQNKDLSWKLIETLEGPEGNVEWNKRTGALPVHKSAEKDPFYAERAVQGLVRRARGQGRGADRHADLPGRIRLLQGFDGHQDQPAGAARRHHARGDGQPVGRLPDQGAAEVPGQEIAFRT